MPNGKPNILVLWGDDIGWWNPSIYNHGQMGYRTPSSRTATVRWRTPPPRTSSTTVRRKPIRIWRRIGRRPLIAGGNSKGDIPMLAFAGTAARPPLRLLVLHDDPEREADYVKGAEAALERARKERWTVISVKDDRNRVFADPTA